MSLNKTIKYRHNTSGAQQTLRYLLAYGQRPVNHIGQYNKNGSGEQRDLSQRCVQRLETFLFFADPF